MNTILKSKGTLGLVALFIVGMFIYNVLFKPETDTAVSYPPASNVGDELLRIRGELEKVTFDQTLFSSKGYLNLVDFGTDIAPQPTGRSNPFDTIGKD